MRNNPLAAVFRRHGRPSVSVEFFPPKDAAAGERMLEAARTLHGAGVDFASITYGAGGSSRDTTLAYGRKLVDMGYAMVGHLTCVGHSRGELAELVARYDEAGFSGILALRGDPPKGQGAFVRHPEGFAHAHELVRLIRAVRPGRFAVSVAGFPERHPDSSDDLSDVRHLAGKVAAGADFVTTQLFLDNADYFSFVARVRAAGVRVPIVPGIMPVLSLKQARSFCGFCKARIPAALERELEACGEDEEAQRRAGVRWAVAQARGLVAGGAPGLHVYVLNRSDSARELFAALRA
ncbi:MAG: methylenetetrahydrofolate reductase [Opitutales bacterium]